jgi:Cys-tRNA(Pro)/Cys-tRNA(Cys) deacylase
LGRGYAEALMAEKTNAMRVLDQRKVPYQIHEFSPEIHSADGVAKTLGFSPSEVYKTLVVIPAQGKPVLVLVAGDREIDLKVLARSLGQKNLRMASHNEAEDLTGLQVGGISALALMMKPYAVFVDAPARNLTEFVISAGKRGINLRLKVADFMKVMRAKFVEATAP